MINIDEIEEICDAMIEEGMDYCPPAGCGTAANVNELITRLRQAEKDAARYRWLRDELEQSQGGIALFDGDCHVCDIDLFIDEAMQCK
ncbi:MAG: hypothetical protein ACRC9V_05930 [Aeromonas sp.]